MPGSANTVSTTTLPPSMRGALQAEHGHDRQSAWRATWRVAIRPARRPLARAVRTKSCAKRLDHAGAHQPQVERQHR